MTAIIPTPPPRPPLPPRPRCAISIRTATILDLPFIDSLQKLHTKMVGWMPTKQLEGKINAGHVLLATDNSQLATPLGYCIGNDQYFKRDDVGIIYQMNVVRTKQRGLIGATLVKAMFDRAAYGCKLFCCWCAQDIEANRFWESLGFLPLAFRAGSRGKSRVHIFWQKRIRQGDTTTPYWFPSQTSAGSIREDRLVLPIPPGTHWSDAKPMILPRERGLGILPERTGGAAPRERADRRSSGETPKPLKSKRIAITAMSGLRFAVAEDAASAKKRGKKPREPKRKVKNDPKHVAAARELRDRWLERVNADPSILLSGGASGKYDVSKELAAPPAPPSREILQLPHAVAA